MHIAGWFVGISLYMEVSQNKISETTCIAHIFFLTFKNIIPLSRLLSTDCRSLPAKAAAVPHVCWPYFHMRHRMMAKISPQKRKLEEDTYNCPNIRHFSGDKFIWGGLFSAEKVATKLICRDVQKNTLTLYTVTKGILKSTSSK